MEGVRGLAVWAGGLLEVASYLAGSLTIERLMFGTACCRGLTRRTDM